MSEISINNGSTYDDADGIEQFDLERLWPTICEACDPVVLDKAYDVVGRWTATRGTTGGARSSGTCSRTWTRTLSSARPESGPGTSDDLQGDLAGRMARPGRRFAMATYYKVLEADFEVATDVPTTRSPQACSRGSSRRRQSRAGSRAITPTSDLPRREPAAGQAGQNRAAATSWATQLDKYPNDCGSAMFAAVDEFNHYPTGY